MRVNFINLSLYMHTLLYGPLLERPSRCLFPKLDYGKLIDLSSKMLGSNLKLHRLFMRESENSIGESCEEKKMEARDFAELVTCIESSIEKYNFSSLF